MKGRHRRVVFVFAVFAAAITLGLLASAQEEHTLGLLASVPEDQPPSPVPEGWLLLEDNIAIMPLESDSGERVGRLMVRNGGVWQPLYLESMPKGIEYLR